ncbi:uncharacterized protein LOC128234751 [Mya arenaria]|uniref:uncharacterized protein LOC128234751 n=1 Tax=Mya arenaria TaxID=6604 RepID=UPI0022E49537|nr:uncharacterized protein LOC128234751 [Mya arenaria]XP_052805199.1 uncharacterized protein LOC128234751 [Mya arenaria]XP_052805209.1 uncharacterized protein LOC128234751 [Mya arenaria]XP_052805217.1 uncharacterized protein LOC128234751 [Mya arenaria]XP_052805226.1 uncharacterized protein LOC128234751 [Mya arenaria]
MPKEKKEGNHGKSRQSVALLGPTGLVSAELLDHVRTKMTSDFMRDHLQSLQNDMQQRVLQSQNCMATLKNTRGFADSVVANRYLIAFDYFFMGWTTLLNYPKTSVDNENDCKQIMDGIHNYACGAILVGHMASQFPLSGSIIDIFTNYLRVCPNDFLAEFLKLKCELSRSIGDEDVDSSKDYAATKTNIRSLELFAHKLETYKDVDMGKCTLIDTYLKLASLYAVSDQSERSRYLFQLCHDLDPANVEAMYGIAYHCWRTDPEKAKEHLTKFIDTAHIHQDHSPQVRYLLGIIHRVFGNNVSLARKYYALGEEAENKILPFNDKTPHHFKRFLNLMIKAGLHEDLQSIISLM